MVFSYLRRYLRARKLYLEVTRELSSFSDYELSDFGVNRADIARLAKNAAAEAWKERPRAVASRAPAKPGPLEGAGGKTIGAPMGAAPQSP